MKGEGSISRVLVIHGVYDGGDFPKSPKRWVFCLLATKQDSEKDTQLKDIVSTAWTMGEFTTLM